MSNHHHSSDIWGAVAGFIGFILSKLTTPIISSQAFPSLIEILHAVSLAVICAVAGFITQLACKKLYKYLSKKTDA